MADAAGRDEAARPPATSERDEAASPVSEPSMAPGRDETSGATAPPSPPPPHAPPLHAPPPPVPPRAPYPYRPAPLPGPFDRIRRLWPTPEPAAASPTLLVGAVFAGLVGGAALMSEWLGLNVLLTVVAVAIGIAPVARKRLNRTSALFGALMLGLVAMAALRDAEWIVALSLLLAFAVGSYALVGGRSWVELLLGGCSVPMAGVMMLPWTLHGVTATAREGRGDVWRVTQAVLISVGLLLLFGGLLTSADAAFGKLAADLIPDMDFDALVGRGFLFVFVGGSTLAAAYLAAAPPRWDRLTPGPARPTGLVEWTIPLAVLNALFLTFATIQAAVLLADDRDAFLRSTGLTYAEYARQGFFQLVAITVLVIVVIAVAARKAPRDTARGRAMATALLGLLCALTLVIVAVALSRLGLYERQFGLTRLRLWVHAFELWLGLVIVLIAVAGVWRSGRQWLPRAVAATGAAGLIALGAINPDALIAERNVERFQRTGKIDVYYLDELSADAVPALDRLPEPLRSCALRSVALRLGVEERSDGRGDDSWYTVNLGRHRARAILRERPTSVDFHACMESTTLRD